MSLFFGKRGFVRKLVLGVLRERVALCLVLALFMLFGIGYLRRDDPGQCIDRRLGLAQCCDVVVAGDSRVFFGVSTIVMERELPGLRVINYGFFGNGYSDEYLTSIEKMFDPASRQKIVVLGITPSSLTADSIKHNSFIAEKQRLASQTVLERYSRESLAFTEPMRYGAFLHMFVPGERADPVSFSDGQGRVVRPIRPEEALGNYRLLFIGNPVADQAVDNLMDRVGEWRQAGIGVYAFRPPTTRAMVELEQRMSGFDETGFKTRFAAVGGTWLDIDQYRYLSYDGSHLHSDGAIQLSIDLSDRIQAIQNGRPDLAQEAVLSSR